MGGRLGKAINGGSVRDSEGEHSSSIPCEQIRRGRRRRRRQEDGAAGG